VTPYLTRPLLDQVLLPAAPRPEPEAERARLLGVLVLAMALAQLGERVVRALQGRTTLWLSHSLAHDLRCRLFERLQQLPLRYFDLKPPGTLSAAVAQDTEEVEALLSGAGHALGDALTLLGIGAVLCWMSPSLFLAAMLPTLAGLLATRWMLSRLSPGWDAWWESRGLLGARLSEAILGIRVVKAFAQEERQAQLFAHSSLQLAQAGLKVERAWGSVFPFIDFCAGGGLLLAWYCGGHALLEGRLTAGTLLAFTAYLMMFYGPLQSLSGQAEVLGRGLLSALKIDATTFNGREIIDLKADGSYSALLNIAIANAPGVAGGAAPHALQVKADFGFAASGSGSNDSLLSGTATVKNSALGTYTVDLKNIKFTHSCDGTAGGTLTLRGSNGAATVNYGPACDRICVSINGSAESCS